MQTGTIRKMHTRHHDEVHYSLPIGEQTVDMNNLIGHSLKLHFTGLINCISCGRKTNKSFNQGYCYPCFRSLPECDPCIVRPELCDPEFGTLRDKSWGLANLMQPHTVYLANSSGVKVGITRNTQIPTRWMDQGASQAMPILSVANRFIAGLVEVMFKSHIADRTDWRKMLKGKPPEVDLGVKSTELLDLVRDEMRRESRISDADLAVFEAPKLYRFDYPVRHYPKIIKAHNFDKTPAIEGVLNGIKGQYLIFDNGVLNIRKYAGYEIALST